MNNTEESFLGRVMSGGLWLSASALAGRFMGLFTTILILRTLSVRDYGTYNLLLAAFGLLASFFISGFDSLVINDLARERGEGRHDRIKRLFLEYGLLKALIGVGLFFISFFGSWFLARWYDAGVVRLLHTISYLFLFVAVERMMNLLFEVYLKFRAIALFDIVEEAAKLFFFFVFVRYLGEGVGGLVRAYMFSTALGLVLFAPYGLTLLRRLLGYRAVRERMLWGLARNHGKWGIASQYLTEAQRSVMPWLVKIFAGTEAVGLYSLAEGIYAQIVSLFPLANLLSPLIPGEIRNKDRMRSIIVYGIKYGTALFALIGVVAFFGIPFLLTWFFPRYLPAVLLFRIMLLALLTTAGANIVNTILYSFREQRILFFLMTVRLAFLVAATSTFMAAFGLAGAAMGFVASAVFFVLIRYWSLRRVAPDIHIPAADFFSWGAEDRRFLARVGSETLRYSSALLGLVRAFLRVLYRALLRQWAVFLIIAVVLASCAPILFLGRIYFDEEQLGFYYPQSFFLGQSLRAGTSLFWNNAYYGGVSVSLDQFVGSFYPPHWLLFRLLPSVTAHHVSIALAMLGGCLIAYWFGRSTGLKKPAAFVFAMSYLTATTFDWLDIGTLATHAFLVFPAMFLALWKISRGERPFFFWLLGGPALGVGLLAGFAQIIFYEYVAVFFWMIFLVWRQRKEAWRMRLRPIIGFVALTVLGVLLGGRQSVPSALFINDTIRSSTLAMEKGVVPKPTELLTLVLPEYISLPFFGAGSPGLYAGSLGLLTALFGFFFLRTELSIFFAGLYGIILGLAFRLPVFGWLNDHVPPFSHMSGQFRWLVAGALPLAYLAGHGFEALVSRDWTKEQSRRWLKTMGWIIGAVVAMCLAGGAAIYAIQTHPGLGQKIIDWRFLHHPKKFSNEYYLHILQTTLVGIAENFSLLQWRLLVPLVLLAGSFFGIRFRLTGGISRRTFTRLAVFLVAGNVLLIPFAKFKYAYVPASVLDQEPRIVQEIKAREQDADAFRIAGFLIGDSIFLDILSRQNPAPREIAAIYRELLINNMNVFYAVQRIDGMEPYRTLRHNQLLDTVLFPKGLFVFDASSSALATSDLHRYINTDVLKEVSLDEKVRYFLAHIGILSMLNVKYVYSLIPLSDPRLHEIRMAQNPFVPVPIHLYENSGALPRIFVARDPQFFSGRDIDLLQKIAATRNFENVTFIECASCARESSPMPGSKLAITRYENGLMRAEVFVPDARWLVLGESYMPGWVATVDGERVPIYRANYIFQAVRIPAGGHMVEFRYHDIMALKWQEFLGNIPKR